MKLFKLTRTDNIDFEEYVACIVAAEDEAKARLIHPSIVSEYKWKAKGKKWMCAGSQALDGWPSPEALDVELLGEAANPDFTGVVLASYNAG